MAQAVSLFRVITVARRHSLLLQVDNGGQGGQSQSDVRLNPIARNRVFLTWANAASRIGDPLTIHLLVKRSP